MWICPKCKRIFAKIKQPHSCKEVPLDSHFINKAKSKELFNVLVNAIGEKVGKIKVISIPCCIHLFGSYDFLAALPKKDRLEIRFVLERKLTGPKIKQSVQLSAKYFKNCIDLTSVKSIDKELIDWIDQSYRLKSSIKSRTRV